MRYLLLVLSRTAASVAALAVTLLPALVLQGCKDITRFSTGDGEAYCGDIVLGGFVREGFGTGVTMRLHLDTDRLQDAPGVVSTSDGLFVDAPLRPIPQLAHDSLSTLQFGEGRVRNLLFGAQPTEGATAYVVISLLENESVEVRVLRGAPAAPGEQPSADEQGPELFGVFPLVRRKGTCGF